MSKRTRHIFIWLLILCIPLISITAYNGLSRWPTHAAVGGPIVAAPAGDQLSVAFFNIASGRGQDGKIDLQRTATMLGKFDYVGLAETRGFYAGDTQADQLGKILDLKPLFAPTEHTRFHDEFGNAILTRVNVDHWLRIPLPGTQSSGHRNVVVSTLQLGKQTITIISTHIDRVIDRTIQLQYLFQLSQSIKGPMILMGDFNTRPDDPQLKPFFDNFTDVISPKLPTPTNERVDWIFIRNLDVTDSGLVPNTISDHPLVYVNIKAR